MLLPGLDVVEQVLPAITDVLDLFIDLILLGLIAGADELLSQLLQMSLVLTEQVYFLHAVLQGEDEGNVKLCSRTGECISAYRSSEERQPEALKYCKCIHELLPASAIHAT